MCRALDIPIHMIFPRLFTCPTLLAENFKVGAYRPHARLPHARLCGQSAVCRAVCVCISLFLRAHPMYLVAVVESPRPYMSQVPPEFEVNVVVMLQSGDMVTENFPVKLIRSKE